MPDKATPTDECTLSVMKGVREYGEGYDVQLYRDPDSSRLVIRAFNQATCDEVRIDLWDLVDWLKTGQIGENRDNCIRYGSIGHNALP